MILCRAFAKVNLTLEVLARRSDGYHDILSVIQAIDLHDTVRVKAADDLTITCNRPGLAGPNNLALRAASLLREQSGVRSGAAIALKKRIPVAAGLGGGSSDAAATLLALRRLWGLAVEEADLLAIAAELGSDVPFFLKGGTAMVSERGERVTPLGGMPARWLLLLRPNLFMPGKTAKLYGRLTADDYDDGAATRAAVEAIAGGQFPAENLLLNTFEKVAYDAFPGLGRARALFETAGGRAVHLSGAGPTLFGVFDAREDAERTFQALGSGGRDWRAWVVRTGQWRPVAVTVE